ncbi:MAG TPA: amidohydrolase [Candidatus Hydrogenedentes bacterium]|nr:amidohydrolase [Candidatus Hydrogenedentota bacterium]
MIIDCHAHIVDATDHTLDEILARADRAGIDRICISSLGRRAWDHLPSVERLIEADEDVCEAVAKHPDRFIGAVYISADHVEKSLELLDKSIANGPCRMLKWWISQLADDPRLNPIVERCIELDVPILAHTWTKATGNHPNESTCWHVVNMARRYPEMKIWMAHCGGLWEESARVVQHCANVCMDISGGEPEDGIVDCLLRHIGPERIFYGSDIPGRSFVVQMSKVLSSNADESAKRMILGESVRRWLHV